MIYYHGTTDKAASQIKSVGLRPHRQTSYRMTNFYTGNPLHRDIELLPLVYLTPNKHEAESYAQFRTAYEKALPGELLDFNHGDTKFIKTAKKHTDNVSPVLITFDVPSELEREFVTDENDNDAIMSAKPIPASYIKSIEPLPELPASNGV